MEQLREREARKWELSTVKLVGTDSQGLSPQGEDVMSIIGRLVRLLGSQAGRNGFRSPISCRSLDCYNSHGENQPRESVTHFKRMAAEANGVKMWHCYCSCLQQKDVWRECPNPKMSNSEDWRRLFLGLNKYEILSTHTRYPCTHSFNMYVYYIA